MVLSITDFVGSECYPCGKGKAEELLNQVPELTEVVIVPPSRSKVRNALTGGVVAGNSVKRGKTTSK